jgi:hypothetical protein
MSTYPQKDMPTTDLCLGDVVKVFDGAWGTAIVKNVDIKENVITFFRPYGTKADFSHTGGVICYTGVEEFSRAITGGGTYYVYWRDELK